MQTKTCRKCGHANAAENKFCAECGSVFKNMAPQIQTYHQNNGTYKIVITLLIVAILICVFVMLGENRGKQKNTTTLAEPQDTSSLVALPCTHVWTPADCMNPRTCSECGETEGYTVDHQWVEATYSAPKTCSVCQATEGEALVNHLADLIRKRVPIVTRAMNTTQRVYGYEDSTLTKKNDSLSLTTDDGKIVITNISDDGSALEVYFPTGATEKGYEVLWFAFDDIISLEKMKISYQKASTYMDTYWLLNNGTTLSRCGGLDKGWDICFIGTHESGYSVILYPVFTQELYDISVQYKVAFVKDEP